MTINITEFCHDKPTDTTYVALLPTDNASTLRREAAAVLANVMASLTCAEQDRQHRARHLDDALTSLGALQMRVTVEMIRAEMEA